ncbi:MAG: hypothetical protein WBM50_20535 [Acidimicrobiales bacterium]
MTTIASFLMVTIDGFHEGPDGEFDFWDIDDAFNEFSAAQLDDTDTLLFGRATFEGTLINHRLLDELRIMTNATALGSGRSPFRSLANPTAFDLHDVRRVGGNNVLTTYRPRGRST